jgi:hypothetical protein
VTSSGFGLRLTLEDDQGIQVHQRLEGSRHRDAASQPDGARRESFFPGLALSCPVT